MSKKVTKKEESKIFFLGAINKKNGEYVFPKIANKKDEYMCPDCNKDLVLCQGKIRIHHFRHKVEKENKCTYYDKPTEAQVHKDAKFLLKKLLEDNTLNIYFTRSCSCCSNLKASCEKFKLSNNSKIVIEHRFNFNNSVKIADVAHTTNDKLVSIFEIYNTHQTKDIDRPEPWYEINANGLIELVQSTNLIENKTLDIRCIRPGKCNSCIKKEEKQKLIKYFKSNIIPCLLKKIQSDIYLYYDILIRTNNIQYVLNTNLKTKHIEYIFEKTILLNKMELICTYFKCLENNSELLFHISKHIINFTKNKDILFTNILKSIIDCLKNNNLLLSDIYSFIINEVNLFSTVISHLITEEEYIFKLIKEDNTHIEYILQTCIKNNELIALNRCLNYLNKNNNLDIELTINLIVFTHKKKYIKSFKKDIFNLFLKYFNINDILTYMEKDKEQFNTIITYINKHYVTKEKTNNLTKENKTINLAKQIIIEQIRINKEKKLLNNDFRK